MNILSALRRLLEAWLSMREQAAQGAEVTLDLPYFTADANGPRHLKRAVTPADLARLEGRKNS